MPETGGKGRSGRVLLRGEPASQLTGAQLLPLLLNPLRRRLLPPLRRILPAAPLPPASGEGHEGADLRPRGEEAVAGRSGQRRLVVVVVVSPAVAGDGAQPVRAAAAG